MEDGRVMASNIQRVISGVSPEEYPNIYSYLASKLDDGSLLSGEDGPLPYDVANTLLTMDEPKELPGCLETMTEEAEDRVAGPVYLRLGRMFLDGIGVDQNLKNAMICFQKAEAFLYDMVLSGDVMYRKSLNAALRGQEKTRKKMAEKLPAKSWGIDS